MRPVAAVSVGKSGTGAAVVDLEDGRVLASAAGRAAEDAWRALPAVLRGMCEVVLVEGVDADALGAALRMPTAGVGEAPPAEPVVGLAPGETHAFGDGKGALVGFAWRGREAWEPLYFVAGHRVTAGEALAVAKVREEGGVPLALARAREAAGR